MTDSDHRLANNASTDAQPAMVPPRRDHGLRAMRAFTLRQLDVLRELAKDRSNKEIARALMLSPETVHHHLKAIYPKLDVNKRDDAVAEAWRRAIIS